MAEHSERATRKWVDDILLSVTGEISDIMDVPENVVQPSASEEHYAKQGLKYDDVLAMRSHLRESFAHIGVLAVLLTQGPLPVLCPLKNNVEDRQGWCRVNMVTHFIQFLGFHTKVSGFSYYHKACGKIVEGLSVRVPPFFQKYPFGVDLTETFNLYEGQERRDPDMFPLAVAAAQMMNALQEMEKEDTFSSIACYIAIMALKATFEDYSEYATKFAAHRSVQGLATSTRLFAQAAKDNKAAALLGRFAASAQKHCRNP